MAGAALGLPSPAQAQITVLSRQPARHAVAVARTAPVVVGFSQPITAASAAGLRVQGGQRQGKRTGSVSGGGTATLTFTPNQSYAPGEVLSVSVPASLAGTGGGAVARQVYQFTAATGGAGRGFFLDTARVGNTTTRDQVLGDLDNDGDLDLLTTGALFGCRVFLNDGAGKFIFKTGFLTGEVPAGLALTDVNQDGYLDVLSGDSKNNLLAVRINDGTGDFFTPILGYQNAPVGAGPTSVAAGDLDGDGDQDFVTANAGGTSASVWLNGGTATAAGYYYTTPYTVALGGSPTAVALGDIDNDGDLDLLLTATTGSLGGIVYVLRNSGNGTFGGGSTTVAVGLQPSELAVADLDADGDLDLLTANAGAASVSVRLNNGSGTFSGTTTLALPAGSTPSGLRTGDLDADGDLDLLVAQGQGGRLFTFLNTAGTLAPQGRALRLSRDASLATVGVTLGDVDGDGDLDAITSDDEGNVLLSRNVGPPPALPAPVITSLAPDSGPVGATVALTGANLTDVTGVFFNGLVAPGFALNGAGTGLSVAVPAGASSGYVTIVTEDAGTATSPVLFTVTVPVPVLLTSIAPGRNTRNVASGTPVVATFAAPITAGTAGQLRVFGSQRRGRQPGTTTGGGTATLRFTADQNFAPGELLSISIPASLRAPDGNAVSPQVVQFTTAVGGTGRHDFFVTSTLPLAGTGGLRLGDLDNDGDLDLAAPGGTPGVLVQLNTGNGTFASGPSLTSPGPADVLALGDVDADGDLDVLSHATSLGSTTIWLNDGRGSFARAGSLAVSGSVTQLQLADLDADGDQDLLAVAGGGVSILLNSGNGTFAAKRDFSPGLNSVYDLALGDLDGDGDLDMVLPGLAGYYTVAIALNNGAGTFSPAASLALPSDAVSRVALGDLDADGDLDLALMSYINYEQRVLIRLNDGRARFGAATASLLLTGPALALADSDADGDLDVLTGLGVGLNSGTGSFPQVIKMADAGTSATLAAVGDLDGDGDLDLLSNDLPGLVRVRLNRPGPPPTLTGLTPGSGPVGSSVRLTGTNLGPTTAVTFNGTPAAGFSVISATQLVATVPTGATSGPITLLAPTGTATTATAFAVTRPLATTGLSPARNAPSAPRSAVIGLTFGQAVSSASAAELRVMSRGRGQLAGTLAGGGTATLTFTPSQAVAAGEVVSVTIPDRLTGADGSRALRQTYQFTAAAGGTGTGLFLPGADGRPYAAYGSRYSFAVGDIDADGDPDLVTTTGFVRFNNGEGTFADSADYALFASTISPARRVVLGDLDGDGDLDLLSSNGDLFFNAGQGALARQPTIAGLGESIRDLALGDLDSDGDLDLVAPNYARDSVYVLFNDGAGRFPARLAVAVGNRPAGLALGDIDNDGDLDLLTANEGQGAAGSTLSVGFNNGIGWFSTVRTLAAGTGLGQVVLGDVDGDLDLDLVTNNGLLQLNDGQGSFTASQATPAGPGVALADIDADGDLDLVVAGAGATALRRNDGRGQFGGAEMVALGSGSQGHDPVLADLDNDGDLDMLTADAANNTVYLSLNQRVALPKLASFAPASELPGATVVLTGSDFIGTTSVLFNGVPAPGFTVVTASRIVVQVPTGATSGLIQLAHPRGPANSATAFTVLRPVAVAGISPARNATVPTTAPVSATFSQAISTNTAANLLVFSQQRGGLLRGTRGGAGSATLTFAPGQPYLPGEQLSVSVPPYTDASNQRVARQVYQFRAAVGGTGRGEMSAATSLEYGSDRIPVLGDVDGDGDLDLLFLQGKLLQLQRNDGQGRFGLPTALFTYPQETGAALALGDVDGDGDLDLAAADVKDFQHNSVVNVLLNDGAGRFTHSLDVPVGEGPYQVALADLDADGDLDLLTNNSGRVSATTSVRLNDGTGRFAPARDEYLYGGGNQYYASPLLGDIDGDGDLDMVVNKSFICLIRFNDGQGHFTQRTTSMSLFYDFVDIALSDADGDGDLDLLLLRVNNGLFLCRNDGQGNFGEPTSTGWMPGGYDRMSLGDLDADGDLDLVLTGMYLEKGLISLNDGRGNFSFTQEMPMFRRPLWPVLGDLDGDGDLDFVHVTFGELRTRFNGPGKPLAAASAAPAPQVAIYPNPAHEHLTVAIPAALRPTGLDAPAAQLYNALGQLVLTQPLPASGELELRAAHLPAGLYTLRLPLKNGPATYKISLY